MTIRECTDCTAEARHELASGPGVHAIFMKTEGIGGSSHHYNFTDGEIQALVLHLMLDGWELDYTGYGYWDLKNNDGRTWRWLDPNWTW